MFTSCMFTLHILVHYSHVYKFICILILMIFLVNLPEIIIPVQKSTFSHYFSLILGIFQGTSPFVLCILPGTVIPLFCVFSQVCIPPCVCAFFEVLFLFVLCTLPGTLFLCSVYYLRYFFPFFCAFSHALFSFVLCMIPGTFSLIMCFLTDTYSLLSVYSLRSFSPCFFFVFAEELFPFVLCFLPGTFPFVPCLFSDTFFLYPVYSPNYCFHLLCIFSHAFVHIFPLICVISHVLTQ